jgi:hypothetical protein
MRSAGERRASSAVCPSLTYPNIPLARRRLGSIAFVELRPGHVGLIPVDGSKLASKTSRRRLGRSSHHSDHRDGGRPLRAALPQRLTAARSGPIQERERHLRTISWNLEGRSARPMSRRPAQKEGGAAAALPLATVVADPPEDILQITIPSGVRRIAAIAAGRALAEGGEWSKQKHSRGYKGLVHARSPLFSKLSGTTPERDDFVGSSSRSGSLRARYFPTRDQPRAGRSCFQSRHTPANDEQIPSASRKPR